MLLARRGALAAPLPLVLAACGAALDLERPALDPSLRGAQVAFAEVDYARSKPPLVRASHARLMTSWTGFGRDGYPRELQL
jgi:hypothetical protein